MKVKLRDVYEVPAVFGRTSDPHQQYLLSHSILSSTMVLWAQWARVPNALWVLLIG